ncbi:dTDP-glucose 4,6-dehydratase [Exiguobacterium sp. s123]|uniref:dTDP-glucose 4,6-dehydratase n=1 Tax=Exiguobacterium sp. s123 TaxID=2751289 RepID=UPI001BE74487|nr:dTDP-glucose 4,6-dehydratase [Exiguobacterium sp. s123]
MHTILVTGGAGFIGSNFIKHFRDKHPTSRILNVDALTYAGNLENVQAFEHDPLYVFRKVDIRNRPAIDELFSLFEIDEVVHFAAESHVDRSILEPELFLSTNILGTQVLLDAAMRHWKRDPDDKNSREYRDDVCFVHVSTDEVYGSLGETGFFTEETPLAPNSPYSASKAGSDLLVRSYHETYGLPIKITRCSNNYGPYQFPEKLIPLMVHHCMTDQLLPVYGDGGHIRDWLHVKDHCEAIDLVRQKGQVGEVYNIGGHNEKTNLELVRTILRAFDLPDDRIQFVTDRPGHDRRYAIDAKKMQDELGWVPRYSFEQGIEETIEWYRSHPEWVERIVSGAYKTYYQDIYSS